MARSTKYDDLLDAAELIVRRDGSARLTLDAVAAEAGVSKGGLLYHFATKEALVSAMVERMLASFDGAQERAMATDPVGPGRWTRAWVRTSVSPKGPSEHDATAAGLLAAVATNPELVGPVRERYVQWRARAVDDGILAETAAIVTLAADGLWMADLLGLSAPVGEERRRIIERLLEMATGPA
jgi:AcrR family transcriptional regulator